MNDQQSELTDNIDPIEPIDTSDGPPRETDGPRKAHQRVLQWLAEDFTESRGVEIDSQVDSQDERRAWTTVDTRGQT
jgi:hypothetical protein